MSRRNARNKESLDLPICFVRSEQPVPDKSGLARIHGLDLDGARAKLPVAIHEAGHVIMSVLLRREIRLVTIVPAHDADGEDIGGRLACSPHPMLQDKSASTDIGDAEDPRRAVEEEVLIALAGPAAAHWVAAQWPDDDRLYLEVALGGMSSHPHADYRKAEELLWGLLPRRPGDPLLLKDIYVPGHPALAKLDAYRERMETRTERMLTRHRVAGLSVARRLMRSNTLTGAQVKEVLLESPAGRQVLTASGN